MARDNPKGVSRYQDSNQAATKMEILCVPSKNMEEISGFADTVSEYDEYPRHARKNGCRVIYTSHIKPLHLHHDLSSRKQYGITEAGKLEYK